MTVSEVELVELCLSGDAGSMRTFVEQHQSAIFGLCLRMLGQRQDAEDITQDVFVRAFRSLHRWDKQRPVRPWLLAIAGNCCRTALSQRGRQPPHQEYVEELPARPGPTRADGDFSEILEQALNSIRPDYRTCFILFHQQEMSVLDIAATLGSPEGTIKTWLHRARKELAEYLKLRGFGDGTGVDM